MLIPFNESTTLYLVLRIWLSMSCFWRGSSAKFWSFLTFLNSLLPFGWIHSGNRIHHTLKAMDGRNYPKSLVLYGQEQFLKLNNWPQSINYQTFKQVVIGIRNVVSNSYENLLNSLVIYTLMPSHLISNIALGRKVPNF